MIGMNSSTLTRHRLLPLHAGILTTIALIPVWYRLPFAPPLLPPLYVSRFLILLPTLWSIVWWLLLGLPGFRELRKDRLRAGWALALLLLALWGFASATWAFQRVDHPEVAATSSLQFGIVALFALVVACAGPPKRWMIATLVVGMLLSSLIGGMQVALQNAIGLTVLGEFPVTINSNGVSVVQAGDVRWLRPYGLLPHPNPLAGALAIGLLAAGTWILSKRWWLWLAGIVITLVGLWVFLLTFSRAAWGGFVIGALALLPSLWHNRQQINRRRIALSLASVLLAGGLFVMIYQPFLLARAGVGSESIEQRSISDRLVFQEFALRAIGEYPLTGVGIGNFPWRASYYLMFTDFDLRGDNVHNIYLSAWAELGIAGLGLYLTAMLAGAAAALRQRHDLHSMALFGGFVALAAIGLLDHYPFTLIQFQIALWGLLAAAGRSADNHVLDE